VLVGFETADDAGVYLLNPDLALVQTVDFFTPIVDDPFVFGQIAAANALSDIYAMGATPIFALSVVGFPVRDLPESVLKQMLAGGAQKMIEAKVAILGGHSVQDPELKLGYAVTGTAHPSKIYTNRSARPGDSLILTKPLGTGTITTGIKRRLTSPEVAATAINWMLALNDRASRALAGFDVNAVTDITGYGLIGHAFEVAAASNVTLTIRAVDIPFIEGAMGLAERNVFPGAVEANRRYVGDQVEWSETAPVLQKLLLDPQTSGGLLISLPEAQADGLLSALSANGVVATAVGRVVSRGVALIQVV